MEFQEEFFKKHNYYSVISLLLQKGETVQMRLYGYCMTPFVRNGDLVTIAPVRVENLRCGDIVVYKNGDKFKIHRFLRFRTIQGSTCIITKGDRAVTVDPPVSSELILGKLVSVHRKASVVDFNSLVMKVLNFIVGKLSPYYSLKQRLFNFPRRCASVLFKKMAGITYREWTQRKESI